MKNAVNFIGEYERTLMTEARRHGVDGVICGHIHHAVIRDSKELAYINCGDWVESCTAVVEQFDGRFEIIDWTQRSSNKLPSPPPAETMEHDRADRCAVAQIGVPADPCL